MALVSGAPSTLEEALSGTAANQSADITSAYARRRKSLVNQEAATGRLSSGVSDYDFADLGAEEGAAQAGVQDNLASSLSGISSEDYLNQKNFARKQQLAQLIGRLNKPSTLDEVFGGVGTAANLGVIMAGFGG